MSIYSKKDVLMNKYDILKKYYGYSEFKYPQEQIIDSVLSKQDTIAILPTGYGKSLTFQIPALIFEGITIIISPLISLMEDQVKNLNNKGIKAFYINANLDYITQVNIMEKLKKKSTKILYVSPERLENIGFLKFIVNLDVSLIVLDEAHTILWGESFREAFVKISNFVKKISSRPPILAVTATATNSTISKIKGYLDISQANIFQINMDRKNIYFDVVCTEDKFLCLVQYLKNILSNKVIIYCLTVKRVEDLSQKLKEVGISNLIYHGQLNSQQKYVNQHAFSNGEINLIICTNAFGMGIDIPDIRYVINYEIPASLEDLVQQIGRAGRDNINSYGLTLFSFKDLAIVKHFISSINTKDKEIIKNQYLKLNKVVDYCLTKKCRHQYISSYFGYKISKCYNMCNNCKKGSKKFFDWF